MLKTIFLCSTLLFITFCFSQNQNNTVEKLLDSVEVNYYLDKEKGFEILEKTHLKKGTEESRNQVRYYKIKSDIYSNVDGYTEDYYENIYKAIALSKKLKFDDLTGELYLILALGQTELRLLDLADDSIKKIEFYAKKSNSAELLKYLIPLKAEILFHRKMFSQSVNFLIDNESIIKNADDIYIVISFYIILTENYISLGKINEAFTYLEKLKNLKIKGSPSEIQSDIGFKNYYIAELEYNLSVCILENNDKRIEFVKEVVNKPIFNNDFRIKERFFKLASKYYLKINNLDLHKKYNDSLIDIIKDNAAESSVFMEKSSVKLLESHEELLDVHKNKNRLIILCVLLAFILILGYIFYKNRLLKRKVEALEYEEKLLSMNSVASHNAKLKANVNALQNYIKEVKTETQNITLNESNEDIKERIKLIHKKVKLNHLSLFNSSLKQLEVINEINAPFFLKLEQDYPILSELDRIICYFIIMDFKNNEIATFLNNSIRAIESRRFRISKKLKLSKEESLKEFLEKNIIFITSS